MLQTFIKLLKKEYIHLNHIKISKSKLIANFKYLSSLDHKLQIAPVLKSNAYGHGLAEVSQILDPLRAPFFCVDSLHEAYRLYLTKVKTPIFIMGYFEPHNLKVKKLPFQYSVFDLNTAQIINDFQPGAKIHLKVDTGMHRLGVTMEELPQFLEGLKKFKNLEVVGLMSHFAISDKNNQLYKLQVKNFQKAKGLVLAAGFLPQWFHLGATVAVLNSDVRKEISEFSNLIRTGRALYGITPVREDQNLHPVLTLTSKIAQIKTLKVGDRVGYDGTFEAKKDLTMAVLPIGYNDGVDRRLSDHGFTLVDNIICPIIGRVSMNMTTIDISNVSSPHLNQEVIIYSSNRQDQNSVESAAKICDTISHELLVHLQSSTKKVIVD